ncbi:hypothetical protein ACQ4PT_000849 [Festuca glaucescens]
MLHRMCSAVSVVITVLEAVAARCTLPALFYLCEVTEDGSVLAGVELELPADRDGAVPRRAFFWSVVWHACLAAYDEAAIQAIKFLQSVYGLVVRDYNYYDAPFTSPLEPSWVGFTVEEVAILKDESRLHFILLSNDDLRAESLQGLVDAVGAGRMDGSSVGKKNILPSSYTGGRRYMIENFQDAVAISRVHGCPDIFTTFTCNPKWPEIADALSTEPGQRPRNRADITVRVYHMKLAEYLSSIRKGEAFGKAVVDKENRGEVTPDVIDSFISAEIPDPEIPDPIEDPLGTAHSRFKIPIDLDANGVCDIRRGTMLSSLIEASSLIIWDEALMTHRKCFEALDRSLRDVLSDHDPLLADEPFGGKVVVLGGDLRQILPVIEGGTRSQVVGSAITNSPLWDHVTVLHLTINQRLAVQSTDPDVQVATTSFAQWVLSIGDGTLPAVAWRGESDPTWITIPDEHLVHTDGDKIGAIVEAVYVDFLKRYSDPNYLRERAILTPTNEGNHMYGQIPPATSERVKDVLGEGKVFVIRKFFCNPSKPAFKPVESPFMVQFTKYTTVEERPGLADTYPFCTYNLTSFADIPVPCGRPERFIDVIGKIEMVSDVIPVQSLYQATASNTRTVILKDMLGNEIRLVLWGDRALEFDAESVRAMGEKEPVIAIFVGTLPKSSHGKHCGYCFSVVGSRAHWLVISCCAILFQVSGSSACRWYIDDDIPGINLFRERLGTKFVPLAAYVPTGLGAIVPRVYEPPVEKTLKDLNEVDPFVDMEKNFLCTATINRLGNDQRWWFALCSVCRKSSKHDGCRFQCSGKYCTASLSLRPMLLANLNL